MDTPQTPPSPQVDPQKDIQENKDIAALGYVWILSIPIYFLRHSSPFVRFHAKQGMVLFAVSIILWVIPVVGRLLELGVLALTIFGFISAAQGKHSVIPLVGAMTRGDWNGVRTDWKTFVHQVGDLFGEVSQPSKASQTSETAQTAQQPHPSEPEPTQQTQSTQPSDPSTPSL